MTMQRAIVRLGAGLLLITGCPHKSTDDGEATAVPPADGQPEPDVEPEPERSTMTSTECEAKGGQVVGDIGDGAIHRPDYRCEGGDPPLGTIVAEGHEPVATEGAVCCAKAQ
ncbi:MAG: hypothetical protein KDK70_44140 [Myxococcales bacterium]|nr:hypothetical protein [Myxococcales bacterium]